jgi:hypothetical protein
MGSHKESSGLGSRPLALVAALRCAENDSCAIFLNLAGSVPWNLLAEHRFSQLCGKAVIAHHIAHEHFPNAETNILGGSGR